MKEEYLYKNVRVTTKDERVIKGVIDYWVTEKGERPFIAIIPYCIYEDEIETIELLESESTE